MRKLLLLTLSAGATFAQLPQDTLRTQLHAPRTVKQKFLAENPNAVEERRTEHSVHFRRPDGTRVALISQYLHWSDPETGQMRAVEPALWTLDNGWRLEGGPVKARIVRSGTTWTFELYQQRGDKQWKAISFTIPEPSYDQGLSFSFTYQKLTWKLRLTETGFDLTAEVAARQGSQTYSFPQAARLLDLSVDPDTGHLTGNGFGLTRAVMVRADGNRTPCSAWGIKGANVSFTCDDSDFPAEAFPYVIDPTGSFYPTAAGDDGWAEGALWGTYGCPAWPGALAASGYWGGTATTINETWSQSAFYYSYCWKYSHQSYVRFDTSSIPSGSTISTASVSVHAASVQDGNQDFYGGAGCAVQADWYASSNWPLTWNEWNLWGAGDAVAPQDLTGKSAGWYSFTLANLANIPVGAGAYAGLKWSVPCDPFTLGFGNLYNEFTFYAFDNGPSTKPYLSVTYSQPAVQHVITSAPAGRSLNVDGAPCVAPCTFQWTAGTQHTIATTTPQAGATGTQYVFSNWSDGGAISHSITASASPATYTANFTTQYYLTTAASPPAGGTITPASGWYNSGAVVAVAANAYGGYVFSGFTGDLSGTTTPQNLTMNAPKSVTANFAVLGTVQHVITSAPVGRSLTVDSAPCTAPCTFQWTPGTGHTIATTTPQSGGSGIRYVFASWSDGGAISHSITASSSPATYTANFTTQYYLTTAASPPAGGTISPASSWRSSGSVVSVSATANTGYQFTGFSGALSGTTTPQNLTMNGPKSVTANFTVSNQPPQAVSVTPSSGSGLGPQAFQFLYSDPNGYANLASLYGRFNATASDVAACSFRYDRATNYIYLYNDAGTAWLGPVVLGNQLTNSQCTLGAGSTTPSGNNLTLNLTITFNSSFAGAKNTYMQAVDAASASSGWQTRGTWTVPAPLTITTASPLPSGAWGVAYSPLTLAATGGTPPYSWSKEDPATNGNLLPSGLTLSAGGVLSGTPTRGGQTYGFWIRVTDSLGATATKTFTLAIGPAVQPIYGPSRLEVGLSYMPFNDYDYDHPASSKFPYSCPPGSSIRGCFQTVLAELRAQGVSGVRIFFGLCGSDSTPLVNCGQNWTQVRYKGNLDPPDLTWINRVKDFFGDVRNAGIQNVTLTPAHLGGAPYSKPKSETRTPMSPPPPDPPIHCADAPDTIYFYPGAPLGYKYLGGNDYFPIGQDDNNAYNCAPINPYFVGWQNQYDVINAMLAAAAEKQLTVSELDFEQELNIMNFPALARFIVDNAQGDSGQPNVRDALRYYMGLHGFDTGRVTWSAPWSNSTLGGYNCTSVYAGYARTMGADQIASAIGGGLIGRPRDPSPPVGLETGYLTCNGNTDIMFQMPSYGTQPNILDVHLRPCVAQPGTHCVLNDAAAAVQSEARIDFDDIVNYTARFPSTATVMLGETHSNSDNGTTGALCEDGTLNAPAETVAGFNQSALAGRSVVFRPWMQLQYPSGDCFKYPGNQRVNFQGSGPYTPTQQ